MMNQGQSSRTRLGRRTFLQILAVAGVAGGLSRFGLFDGAGDDHVVRQSRTMMGTEINLIVCGPDEDACRQAVRTTFTRMEELEGVFSRHREDSELSRLNRDGGLAFSSPELAAVLDLAAAISHRTEGAFDATVLPLLRLYGSGRLPDQQELGRCLKLVDYRLVERRGAGVTLGRPGMALTLDGIAKGYIVDQGVAALKESGFANVYVEAGGDLMVAGAKPAGQPWRIGIRPPRQEAGGSMTTIATATPLAIATSGDYFQAFTDDFRHHHILDPRTGMSPPELASATITASSAALADGLATAALVLGPERGLAAVASFQDCEALLIGKDLRHYRSAGFQG